MAATYSTLGTIATQPDFQNRVNVAMQTAALAVYNESGTVTGHAARAAFASKVANGNFNLVAACFSVLTGTAVGANAVVGTSGNGILDSDIQNQVNAAWNCFAGA